MNIESEELKFEALRKVYEDLLLNVEFDEIEHIPNEMIADEIKVEQNCLCIRHSFFEQYYPLVIKKLIKVSGSEVKDLWMNMLGDVILIMNGQNDKAWSIKRYLLLQNKLDLTRQLRFNAAICYKNKKSFLYYEFRLRLIGLIITQNKSKEELIDIYRNQNDIIAKILSRFHRNYQCWLYRIKLYELFSLKLQQIVQIQVNLLHLFIERNPNDYSAYSRLINIISKNKVDRSLEMIWIKQLQSFCMVAYEKDSSYRHIATYLDYLNKDNTQ